MCGKAGPGDKFSDKLNGIGEKGGPVTLPGGGPLPDIGEGGTSLEDAGDAINLRGRFSSSLSSSSLSSSSYSERTKSGNSPSLTGDFADISRLSLTHCPYLSGGFLERLGLKCPVGDVIILVVVTQTLSLISRLDMFSLVINNK